ncbi:hypothetical protein, partial [Nitrospirillum amazonense]|uniref:hypothetical protein n=1 Tax=Nitrospirillum amazonense TaxID=28077 RepID=UPI002412377B
LTVSGAATVAGGVVNAGVSAVGNYIAGDRVTLIQGGTGSNYAGATVTSGVERTTKSPAGAIWRGFLLCGQHGRLLAGRCRIRPSPTVNRRRKGPRACSHSTA